MTKISLIITVGTLRAKMIKIYLIILLIMRLKNIIMPKCTHGRKHIDLKNTLRFKRLLKILKYTVIIKAKTIEIWLKLVQSNA